MNLIMNAKNWKEYVDWAKNQGTYSWGRIMGGYSTVGTTSWTATGPGIVVDWTGNGTNDYCTEILINGQKINISQIKPPIAYYAIPIYFTFKKGDIITVTDCHPSGSGGLTYMVWA